ncbi:MAG: hypothetical protein ACK4UJ_01705 [Leptonema sp. (in: bacteria)]
MRRSFEKMTVVDTLQAAYAKQDLSEEEKQYMSDFFLQKKDYQKLTKEDIEKIFSILREITDRVSLINSYYPSDLEIAFTRLKEFWNNLSHFPFDAIPTSLRALCLSHLTFHRETISDIIKEARLLLMENRRDFLKTLVNYHREFSKWLQELERKFY